MAIAQIISFKFTFIFTHLSLDFKNLYTCSNFHFHQKFSLLYFFLNYPLFLLLLILLNHPNLEKKIENCHQNLTIDSDYLDFHLPIFLRFLFVNKFHSPTLLQIFTPKPLLYLEKLHFLLTDFLFESLLLNSHLLFY